MIGVNVRGFVGGLTSLTRPERSEVKLNRIPELRQKVKPMVEIHWFDSAIAVPMQNLAKIEEESQQRVVDTVLATFRFGGATHFAPNDLRGSSTRQMSAQMLRYKSDH
jgi:hypothetical protein